MRIVILIMVLLVQAIPAFAAAPQNYSSGITKLQAETGADVLQDLETGRPYCVSGRLSDPVVEGQEFEAALRFLAANKTAYLMSDPAQEVRAERIETDQIGMRHVRMVQQYKGLPVYGGNLIAHFSKDNALTTINGTYIDGIKVNTDPQLSSDQAVEVALRDFESSFGTGEPSRPELIVFPWEGKTHLAWHLELYSGSPVGRWEYFVDGQTGEVIFKVDLIMDVEAVGSGTGVMGGARTHIDTDYDGLQYRMIDNTRQADNNPHEHNGQMPAGNTISTYFAAAASLPGTLAADDDNAWNDPSQAPAVDAQVYTSLFYDWLLATFGRNSFDGAGASMTVSVNYSGFYNNAFWDGRQVTFTLTDDGVRSMAGCPDVNAHEWTHAVVYHTSRLVASSQSGALNESFADMMGAAFESAHPAYDTPDWYIGENAYTDGNVVRDMSNPISWPSVWLAPDYYDPDLDSSNCYDSVCTCSPLNDYCYIHLICGIGDKWFYLLSAGGTHHDVTVTGIGIENAIRVAYRANEFYWTPTTTYSKGAYGTVLAARDLDPSGVWETEVRKAWAAVGVHLPRPALTFSYPNGRPTRLVPGEPTTFEVVINPTYEGTLSPGSAALYYKIAHGQASWAPMTELAPGRFQATLPAVSCGQYIEYLVEAFEATSGMLVDPSGRAWYGAWYRAEPGTDPVIVFSDDFETDKGWETDHPSISHYWERGTPTGGGGEFGGPDPSSAYSGTNVYGYNLQGDYEDGIDNWGDPYSEEGYHLISPRIDCSGLTNVHIDFQRWLGVEHPTWDDACISVGISGVTPDPDDIAWTKVWENPDEITDRAWTYTDIDISSIAAGQASVYVRFGMGPTDEGARYCGWNIDDFRVTAYECNLVADIDADGVSDRDDNCPSEYNPSQDDSDSDSFGDACDRCAGFSDAADEDGDGVPNGCDRCPGEFDGIRDTDGDGVLDPCDKCPGYDDLADGDSDGVPDNCDNCVDDFNPGQEDFNSDGIGEVCCCVGRVGDPNSSGDEPTISDVSILVDLLFISGEPVNCLGEADVNQSGGATPGRDDISISDISYLIDYLFITGQSLGLADCL